MRREEALGILGLTPAEATNFAAVRSAYHRRMWAVHPDLNHAADASEAAALVGAAYDMLDRAYRAQRSARATRDAGASRTRDTGRNGSGSKAPSGSKARVLNDTTVTAMGTPSEVFDLAKRAGSLLGEVSSVDASSGTIVVVAEFLHMAPCQVGLMVSGAGLDRAHIKCSVESLSGGETPPIAAVSRLVVQKMVEALTAPSQPNSSVPAG